MSTGDALGVVAIIVGVIGVLIAIYYGRKALRPTPKKAITWAASSTPLIATKTDPGLVEVIVAGEKMAEPHYNVLSISNDGIADLESSAFDRMRPLSFAVKSRKAQPVAGKDAAAVPSINLLSSSCSSVARGVAGGIEVGPDLLRANESWEFAFISDGEVDISLTGQYLIDVRIERRRLPSEIASSLDRDRNVSVSAAVIGAIASVVAGLLSMWISYK